MDSVFLFSHFWGGEEGEIIHTYDRVAYNMFFIKLILLLPEDI